MLIGNIISQEISMKRIYVMRTSVGPLQKIISIIMGLVIAIGFIVIGFYLLWFLLIVAAVAGIFMWWKLYKLKKNPQFKAFVDQMQRTQSGQSSQEDAAFDFENTPKSADQKKGVIIEGESREIH